MASNTSSPSRAGPGGWGGNQYRHHDRDARVPDSDDSTEEDEEYTSYIQDQEAAAHNNNSNGGGNKVHNMRHMLHDDDQDQDDDRHYQDDQRDSAAADAANRQEVQARQNQILEDDEESFEEDEDDMDDEDDDDASDTNSLTEDDIDFNLVYAFHTFVATQEGQASVVRNDSLMLLEDANVYWWLVRVLKTGVIGYIPAENIETPFERLARLNKYRNVGLSAPSPEWGTFDEPIQPLNAEAVAHKASHRRSVIFAGQNEYFGASDNEWDDEDGEGDEDDEMGEYYESREEGEEGDAEGGEGGKSDIQLEAERVQQEILEEENQRLQQQQQQQQGGQRARKSSFAMDNSDHPAEMVGNDEDEEAEVTNRYRRPLLDDDDLMFNDEPRKISLTPSIAQDDVSRTLTPAGRGKKLRLGDEDSLNGNPRSAGSPGRRGSNGEVSASPLTPRQQATGTGDDASSNNDRRPGNHESEEEDRAATQKRMQERTEAKLAALLGDKESAPSKGGSTTAGDSSESTRKPGKFKSLFGVGKGSKEKEKKEKERLERERLAGLGNKSISTASSPGGNSFASSADGQRARANSSGSIVSPGGPGSGSHNANGPMSPTNVSEDGDSPEIITLRVYPGNVDFGASMYKTVVVNASTMASEVANQAVVKFRLAPDGVASSSDFFLTVRGVDGDETVLLPTDKPMAIYQSLTAHLTTPLPANHRLSISSVSSMMSVNSVSSFNSNPPSTPTSPSSVRRIGSGKSDPHQRSIRFLLSKKIKRGSVSSTPGTPTTPTTPTAPSQEDFFWVKVVCKAQELPQSMVVIDGMRTAMNRSDPRAQGQVFANKVEHWIPMHSASKAGDVIFKTLETIGIRSGVVEGVPNHVLASKRNSAPNGIVIEYQLSLKLDSPVSPRARQGDELTLVPQTPLIRCFDDHQLAPVRRSPKADVASMPTNPEYFFYLKKSPKSVQEETNFAQQQQPQQQQQPRKVPAPLQAQSLFGASSSVNESPRSPAQPSPTTSVTSPRSLRSLRSFDDGSASGQGATLINNGPLSPGRPSQGPDGNIRIPRRTESVILTPTSPIRSTHPEGGAGSRTPTPDHSGVMGRNRSPSVSQGMRPGQAPSPIPNGGVVEKDSSRASTPERPARPERPERPQRAIAQPLTHGPSPLSLTAVMLQANEQGNHMDSGRGGSMVAAPLNIKKNEAQGMDFYLDKGVVRSSRLMNSKQYRYSFIPTETGEEVDISDIIEDILGEEAYADNEPAVIAAKEDVLQHLAVAANSSDVESVSRRDRTAAAVARAANTAASRKERAAANNRDEVISSATRSRVASPVAMRSTMDEQQQYSREGSPSPTQSRQAAATMAQNQNRTLASPLPLSSPSPTMRSKKRESDVEIQMASVASLSTRSASPMLTEQPPSARGSDSPRSLRSGSPYGMAKPTLISNANAVRAGGVTAHSPLMDGSNDIQAQDPSARSFSPIPRRLQSPSPALRQVGSAPSPSSGSPNLRPSSPSSSPNGGRVSPAASTAANGRSNSGASNSSVTSARSRSASASVVADSKPNGGRLAHNNSNSSNHSERVGTPSSPGGNKEWLLSSDYNTGMQDLLTLVRAGRSSSVSSPSNSSMHLLRGVGGVGAGGAGPWIGKDGKLIALPSTIKASLLSNSNSRSQSPSSPSSENGGDSMLRGKNSSSSLNNTRNNKSTTSNDNNDKSSGGEKSVEQTRMMLLMLNELTLKDVQQECHPDVYDCWKDVDADLDRVERELDDLLVTVKASIF
ncbi:hypothetical protein BGX30_013469 [Mortierella sp. GBA39]|nr:hypothetical protein BGX30_013469 [Mortierella sp. GBA39]